MGDTLSQLDYHAAEIIHHRQQHAAHVIDLFGRDGIIVGGFKLADSVHIAHAMDQGDDGFADALFEHFFTDHVCVGDGE